MRRPTRNRNGQALVMVTLALLAMFGVIGLAIDLGWAFYVKRSAQAAADAAAIAAVRETVARAGTGTYVCGQPNVTCATTPQPCSPPPITNDPADNFDNGCLFAQQNGFVEQGNQHVTLQAGVPPAGCFPNCVPTAPGVHAFYWVTARVSENIPQLFSAVLGRGWGISSARATAAVAEMPMRGSLILLNRMPDPVGPNAPPQGTDLMIGGNDTISVPGGILLASRAGGANAGGNYAGDFKGKGGGQGQIINTPFTFIQGAGGQGSLPSYAQSRWSNWYQNRGDYSGFRDPFEGKGQPPIGANTNPIPVPGGTLSTLVCPKNVCAPGIYFSTKVANGAQVADGSPIIVPKGNWQFGNSSSFGEFTFFGGMVMPASSQPVVQFGPGRYVMAGQLQGKTPADGSGTVFATNNASTITGGGVDQNGMLIDAGRLILLTDSTYPGLQAQITAIDTYLGNLGGSRLWSRLYFGTSDFTAGVAGGKSSLSLQGLDKGVTHPETNALGYSLQDFGNIAVWQDQRNSNIKYEQPQADVTNGHYDWTSCGTGYTIENVCPNNPIADRNMSLAANQSSHFEGVIYQPRGSNVTIWAGTGYSGPISIVSGAMYVQGNGNLTLQGPLQPIMQRVPTLVE